MCDVPIRAMVAKYPTDLASDLDAENLTLIGPKDTARFAAPIYLPVGDTLSAWLINPDASVVGTPITVPLTKVREDTATDGSIAFVVTVSGDLCPE